MSDGIDVISAAAGEEVELTEGGGESFVVVGPHTGAEYRTMAVVRLPEGAQTKAMTHPGEAVWRGTAPTPSYAKSAVRL